MNQMLKGKNDIIFLQYVENTILSHSIDKRKTKQLILKEISMYDTFNQFQHSIFENFRSSKYFNLFKVGIDISFY